MLIALSLLILGLIMRFRFIKLPLDWDHGLLLYQSYWYEKLGKFIAAWYDYEPESISTDKSLKIPAHIEETAMIRYQTLGFSFINIINYLICKDKVWAYRILDIVYSLIVTSVIFLWGSLIFDPTSAALGAALFFLFSSMPFYWAAMDNPEKFQILFTISGLLCLSMFIQTPSIAYCILSGIFFFIAMTFKQNVGFVIMCALIFLAMYGGFIAACAVIATLMICYACLFSYYRVKGYPFEVVFGRVFVSIKAFFYLFDMKVNDKGKLQKTKNINLFARIKPNLRMILKESSLLWVMSLLWFIHAAMFSPESPVLQLLVLVLVGTIAAFMAANKFFPYYYIPFLPVLALTSGDLYNRVFSTRGFLSIHGISVAIITVVLSVLSILTTYKFFFKSSPFEQGAYMYSNTLYNFGASEEIGRHIKDNTSPEDYIFVYNLNPEIYFLSQRRCPTNALTLDKFTTMTLNEQDLKRAEQIIQSKIKASSPAYIVINNAINVPIGFFESVTGNKYFLEKEYHAGYDANHRPVYLHMFKKRKITEALCSIAHGEALFSKNKIDEAITAFEDATVFDPLSGDAFNNLGVAYHSKGDQIKAIDYFIKALQSNPSNRDVVLNLLDMDITPQDKLKVVQIFLSLNPDDIEMKQVSRELSSYVNA